MIKFNKCRIFENAILAFYVGPFDAQSAQKRLGGS